jgi:hypothetical protein
MAVPGTNAASLAEKRTRQHVGAVAAISQRERRSVASTATTKQNSHVYLLAE